MVGLEDKAGKQPAGSAYAGTPSGMQTGQGHAHHN